MCIRDRSCSLELSGALQRSPGLSGALPSSPGLSRAPGDLRGSVTERDSPRGLAMALAIASLR
eukprot:7076956-Alexandrium_andersonii.AAC.1